MPACSITVVGFRSAAWNRRAEISQRINAFTVDLLKQCARGDRANENAILSPQSIFHGLAISYVAAGGETRKELASVFHFPDDEQRLMQDLAGLRGQLEAATKHNKVEVCVANSLWLDGAHAEFRKDYREKIEEAFSGSLHTVKFQNGDKASDEINRWVSKETRGKIKGTVDAKDFQSHSRPPYVVNEPALVSVNAVYFKADWGSRFEKGATHNRAFHVDSQTTQNAPMMHQRSLLPYAEDAEFQFLEIPYIDGLYSMHVFLPKRMLGVEDLVSRITLEKIAGLNRGSSIRNVDVLFPKFESKSHYDAEAALKEMGAKDAFDNQRADFDKMILRKPDAFRVYISKAYHDAWIEVHEEGTRAAAATTTTHYSFGCSASPPQYPPAVFHADHPFLFTIVNNKNYDILFAGWIVNPKDVPPVAE